MTTTITTPADITLQQLGGAGRLTAMIGARHFFSDDDGNALCFKFKGSRHANYVKITLTPADLYTVDFKRIKRGGMDVTDTGSFDGICADQLHDLFKTVTGLYLNI